jgi:hypothetical protein
LDRRPQIRYLHQQNVSQHCAQPAIESRGRDPASINDDMVATPPMLAEHLATHDATRRPWPPA